MFIYIQTDIHIVVGVNKQLKKSRRRNSCYIRERTGVFLAKLVPFRHGRRNINLDKSPSHERKVSIWAPLVKRGDKIQLITFYWKWIDYHGYYLRVVMGVMKNNGE